MKRGRLIEIETDTLVVKATTKVRFETPLVEMSKDVKAEGEIADHTRTMQADRLIYNGHNHGGGPVPGQQQ